MTTLRRAALLLLGLASLQVARAQETSPPPDAPAEAAAPAEPAPAAPAASAVPAPGDVPPGEAHSEEDAAVVDAKAARGQTVVTSTRMPVQLGDQPRAMTVVTAEDLAVRPARSTPEALLEQEGVFLQKTNHGGGAPIIRGLYGQQVLLLVDGVRMNNSTVRAGPNQFLNTVDPFLVEQLEVVRGPGSVLYGSDALGGVVNVRTFWPRFSQELAPLAALKAQAGSADASLQGHARAGFSTKDTALAATFSARDFNDLRGGARVGLQRYTGYEEGDAAFKLRQRLFPGGQLYLQYQGVRQANVPRLDRSAPGDFRRFTEQHRDFLHGRLQLSGLSPLLRQLTVELSSHRQGDTTDRFRTARNRMDADAVEVWTQGARVEAELPTLGALPGTPTPLVGVDAFFDRVTSRAGRTALAGDDTFLPVPVDARYPTGATALATGLFGLLRSDARLPLSYTAGVRAQLNRTGLPEDSRMAETFASAAQPPPVFPAAVRTVGGVAAEAGAQLRVLPAWTLLANLGSGFRAPNVDDYLRMGAEGVGFLVPGGQGLTHEQSYTGEVGTRVQTEAFSAQAFYAYTAIPGLIGNVPTAVDGQTRTPDGLPYLTRQNRELVRIQSLEGALSFKPLPQLTLATHATWTWTLQQRQDLTLEGQPYIAEPLSRIPPLNGLVRATWEPTGALFAEGVLRWALGQTALSAADRVDTRICSEAPGCAGTPGWTALHLRGGARLGKHLTAAVTLQNLLDATYRYHGSGVDEPGRSVTLSLETSL
jgi:iron complex outermembrane receptor protein/hemoglobin/transferrin/lactoferrin receptor protein